MQHDRQMISDEEIFLVPDQRMLSVALHSLEEARDGTALRDARSAFRFLSERCGVDLEATVATHSRVNARCRKGAIADGADLPLTTSGALIARNPSHLRFQRGR